MYNFKYILLLNTVLPKCAWYVNYSTYLYASFPFIFQIPVVIWAYWIPKMFKFVFRLLLNEIEV